ncbi:hypothetical protein GIB67_014598 [Kingdonia uniflora]|uniref:Uncharacterized protein n=1 Tax=Kingdonia uniflora TaxID=39325 RepID=A0A7J7MNV4_9MAGN|nr:hypothetical protein GIB67_014598 [Kingdonia uniflora]
MQGNLFEGTIPEPLSALRGLREIDLSRNNFSGNIPQFLAKIPVLEYLNLSFNNFHGEIPKQGVFTNASKFSLLGNKNLCGGISELLLPACPKQTSGRKLTDKIIAVERDDKAFIVGLHAYGHNNRIRMEECLTEMIRMGLACSMPTPNDRIQMQDVIRKLHDIKDSFSDP